MTIADYIALGIIFFLLFCAIRYMIVSKKNGKCSGCCSQCQCSCNISKSDHK